MTQPNIIEEEEDYEYVLATYQRTLRTTRSPLTSFVFVSYSYEALPPNFSLVQNMAAGAFAGIAEHCASMFPPIADTFDCRLSSLGHALTLILA